MSDNSVFDLFDSWWGDRFDASLSNRIALPLDQMLALQEELSVFRPPPPGPLPRFSFEPVMSPWGIENYEINAGIQQAKMLWEVYNQGTQPGEAYLSSPYDIIRAANPVKQYQRPVGPYLVDLERDRGNDMDSAIRSIISAALLVDRTHLRTVSILPPLPSEGALASAWEFWHQDALFRLFTLCLLRPLADASALIVEPSASLDDESDPVRDALFHRPNELHLFDGFQTDELLEGVLLHLRPVATGSRVPVRAEIAKASHFEVACRRQAGRVVLLHKTRELLSLSGHEALPLCITKAEVQRAVLASVQTDGKTKRNRKRDPQAMQAMFKVGLGAKVDLADLLFKASALRKSDEFQAWREALSGALQAVADVADVSELAEAKSHVLNTMRPKISELQKATGMPMTIGEAGSTVGKGVVVGLAAFGAAVAAGATPGPAAAGGIATAIGKPLVDFLASRRKKRSPAWEAFIAIDE